MMSVAAHHEFYLAEPFQLWLVGMPFECNLGFLRVNSGLSWTND
jgi:hypothetical protein